MKKHKNKFAVLIAAILLLGFSANICSAGPISLSSGSLTDGNGLETGGDWGEGTSISWTVDLIDNSYWHYEYTFTSNSSPSLSHFIVQVSDNFTSKDFWNLSSNLTPELRTFSGDENSNPGMPAPIYGIKFEGYAESLSLTWSFDSKRDPMWGNFYAKASSDTYAYNTGLDDGCDFIAVPDTNVVPVPGAVVLGMLGLFVAGKKLRKYA